MNFKKYALMGLAAVVAVVTLYFVIVLKWSYSTGERAGWVQKLSHKGWLCKTWEGELALVSMPGAPVEKFFFTVHDDAVAADINRMMGQRVSLHYDEKVGLPTTCFGDTRYFVSKAVPVDGISLSPGVTVEPRAATDAPSAAASSASAP